MELIEAGSGKGQLKGIFEDLYDMYAKEWVTVKMLVLIVLEWVII